jgi:hypothetical protein
MVSGDRGLLRVGPPAILVDAEESLEGSAYEAVASSTCTAIVVAATPEGIESPTVG